MRFVYCCAIFVYFEDFPIKKKEKCLHVPTVSDVSFLYYSLSSFLSFNTMCVPNRPFGKSEFVYTAFCFIQSRIGYGLKSKNVSMYEHMVHVLVLFIFKSSLEIKAYLKVIVQKKISCCQRFHNRLNLLAFPII